MQQDRIVFHNLIGSRSSRIVWLLEELGLAYEQKTYNFTKEGTAPPEIKSVWPMGSLPIVQIFPAGESEPITLAESGLIVQYLIDNYDTAGRFKPASKRERVLVDYYLHFAEGTIQPQIVSIYVGGVAAAKATWGLGWFVRSIMSNVNNLFYGRKVKTALEFLDGQLAAKDGGYFVGDKLTAADFILDFPVNNNILSGKLKNYGFDIDAKQAYPHLAEWNKLLTERPAYVKALEKEAATKAEYLK